MAIGVSNALSEKAIRRLGLDDEPVSLKKAERVPVKEWDSSDAYWEEELSDRHAKWYVKAANFFKYSIYWRTRDWWIDTDINRFLQGTGKEA